jgi:Ser-tRNA(Ala) deacylase AlaX
MRLYLEDDHRLDAGARVVAVRDRSIAFVHADSDGVVWHVSPSLPPASSVDRPARLIVDGERRRVLTRYHTGLHVLDTIALRDYGGWITGVQIGVDYSRIDFKLEGLSAAVGAELEDKVNAVLERDHDVSLRTHSTARARSV